MTATYSINPVATIWMAAPNDRTADTTWHAWLPWALHYSMTDAHAKARELRKCYHGHLVAVRPCGSAPKQVAV